MIEKNIQDTDESKVEELSITSNSTQDRLARLKELKTRKAESEKLNKKALYEEHKRKLLDPATKQKMVNQKQRAEFELAKLEAEASNEDFERQRAWDWTVEESEKWDKRMAEKKDREENGGFQDYSQAAERAYLKEMREFKPDVKSYLQSQIKDLQKNNIKEVITTENGQIIVSGDTEPTRYGEHKPSKSDIDRLVGQVKKGDERRMKRRRDSDENETTVNYINETNKQFNKKLARHYDKYTKETRDAFERGTAI